MTEKSLVICPSSAPPLPPLVKTQSGAVFDPNASRWSFHDGLRPICVNFQRLDKCATSQLVDAAKFPLLWYAENTDGSTVRTIFGHLRRFLESAAITQSQPVNVINASLLASFRASLPSHMEWKLGSLSAFLKKWHSLGIPGVTADAVKFLNSIRLKGNRKGTAVLTMDPHTGPLSDVERSAIQASLNDAFADGAVSLDDYVLVWLVMLLGQRNIQFAMLKVCDVSEVKKPDGSCDYFLKMPRVKQADSKRRRDEFTERLIAPSIGKILFLYGKSVQEKFKESYPALPSQAPLFPQRHKTRHVRPDFHYHTSPVEIGTRVKRVINSLKICSERTGKQIEITSKRLRHTVATSAAREGHGELIIAELLDHSDTQNVGVYVKAIPEIVERIDRAMAIRMAPLAQAFSGKIIRDESEAVRGNDPASRIVDPRFDEKFRPMGNCSRNGACDFMAPIACYTCNNFQAWIDGPHEMVLEYLIKERERLMKDTDERIATVNDRTILAVADVIVKSRELQRPSLDG